MPKEVYEDDESVGYDPNTIHKNPGAVVFIESVLYGDDQDEQDYAKCAGSLKLFDPGLIPYLV